MDLLCAEKISADSCCAMKDGTVFEDERVLQELLNMEHLYVPQCDYFKTVQSDVEPFMRKVVTKWMLEVCDELHCEDQVFPLAVNLFDRFLCTCDTPKKFLQLVAADCILMASKIRQAVIVSIDTLCYFTNYSVTPCQMRKYELLLVAKLDWDLSAITAFDFVDHILQRIKWSRKDDMIRRHSLILLHLCYTECEFMRMKPSTIATACIISALKGLKAQLDCDTFKHICMLTSSPYENVEHAVTMLEWIVAKESAIIPANAGKMTPCSNGAGVEKMIPVNTSSDDEKPETPTDVQDVKF